MLGHETKHEIMIKYFYILLIFFSTDLYSFPKRHISISDSTYTFEIFYKEKKHHRTQLLFIKVLERTTNYKYTIAIQKPANFKFNSFTFGEDNLSLKDYDKDGFKELLITNINQNMDDDGNQLFFRFNKVHNKYQEVKQFRKLRSPQLQLGLDKIKEFDFWGSLNIEKYYSIIDDSISLDSTIVSDYDFDSKEIRINHKVYFKNTQKEYTEVQEINLSFNLDDTIETIPIKFIHKNFLLNLYFDEEKILRYLIVRNHSNQDLIRLNCKAVGIYLPMQNVIYDSLAYINNDYDLNNDSILDFIFPSSQYGDLYLFLTDQSTNQLYINPRIPLAEKTFHKEGNTLTTRRSNPCGTLPRIFRKYNYSISKGEFLLISQIDIVEYRKRKKIYSLEKTYVFDGMNITKVKTTNRKTKQRI